MTALQHKLARELWQLRMQMLSIALVVAAGVMTVVTMRGSYNSLLSARADYYQQTRFADMWVHLVRAPLALAAQLAQIPGVAAVDTRTTLLATLDLPDVDMPAQGRFVSLPADGRPLLNDLVLDRGRWLQANALDEVLISRKFAEARKLEPGDTLQVVINGRAQRLHIVGIASSPEFSYAVPPGSVLPEYKRFGVFWVSDDFLGPTFNMKGAFNESVLKLDSTANTDAVIAQVDAILEPYGGLGAYARADQLSHLILENELAEIRTHGTVIPAIFLGVAVLLLYQVLGRLIATQRGEIAVLKAFGYSDLEIGRHFLLFALIPVLTGSVAGGLGGIWLGNGLIHMYGQFFELPDLHYRFTGSVLLLASALSLLGSVGGAMAAVRRAVRLPPAEAMRAEMPASYHPGWLEALGLAKRVPAAFSMILRNLQRRPFQAAMSVTGIALALAILVIGMFMFDSVHFLMNTQFRVIQREDVTLMFKEQVSDKVRFELARLPDVTRVETWRGEPARLRAGHRSEELLVTALADDNEMRRLVTRSGALHPLPAGGIVISALLGEELGVVPGDFIGVEWLSGKRLHAAVQVTGLNEDYLGYSAYISKTLMNALTGASDLVSGAYLLTGKAASAELYRKIKQIPAVSGVNSPAEALAVFDAEMARSLMISSGFLLGFAGIIAFGVIYNSARIALAERSRELASLRVLGFHRAEVATLLLGEQALLTVLAMPPGCLIGYWTSWLITLALESKTYRIPFVANAQTYVLASAVIVAAAMLSTIAVRRRLDRIELVSVLKSRE